MATFRDPVEQFAPLEVVERMLQIRAEFGFPEAVYLHESNSLADFLDAYGFNVYAFTSKNEAIDYGKYRAPLVPNGDNMNSLKSEQ